MKIDEIRLYKLFPSKASAVSDPYEPQRWFDIGDTVTFTSCQMHMENAEFVVNNCKGWRIWLTQLNTPLYNGEYNDETFEGLQFCSFNMKNGEYFFPWHSYTNPEVFWNKVRGKRFKVIDAYPCYRPNKKNSKVQRLSIAETYKEVHNALCMGNDYSVQGMLVPAKCYDFLEI